MSEDDIWMLISFGLYSLILSVITMSFTWGIVNNSWEKELISKGVAVWTINPTTGETKLEYKRVVSHLKPID